MLTKAPDHIPVNELRQKVRRSYVDAICALVECIFTFNEMKYFSHIAIAGSNDGRFIKLICHCPLDLWRPHIKWELSIYNLVLGIARTSSYLRNLAQLLVFHPTRAELLDHIVNPTHGPHASRSATMASICSRSSCSRATMPAMRSLSSAMSTFSRVSRFST